MKKSGIKLGAMVRVKTKEYEPVADQIALVVEELPPSEETGDVTLFRIEYLSGRSGKIDFDRLPRWWAADDIEIVK